MTAAGPRRIVFYGSLMEGLTLPGKPDLAALGVTRIGPCTVHAELWDTGLGYPALVRPGEAAAGVVHGELWQLGDPERALPPLDAFEGIYAGDVPGAAAGDGDDARPEYLRVLTRTVEPAGLEAWIYVWNGPTAGMERVADGNWRARIAG